MIKVLFGIMALIAGLATMGFMVERKKREYMGDLLQFQKDMYSQAFRRSKTSPIEHSNFDRIIQRKISNTKTPDHNKILHVAHLCPAPMINHRSIGSTVGFTSPHQAYAFEDNIDIIPINDNDDNKCIEFVPGTPGLQLQKTTSNMNSRLSVPYASQNNNDHSPARIDKMSNSSLLYDYSSQTKSLNINISEKSSNSEGCETGNDIKYLNHIIPDI